MNNRFLFESLQADLQGAIKSHRIPGAALAVFHDGGRHEAYAGVENVAAPSAVNGNTLFQIGSISKAFTATLIVKLAEQGTVDLDAPVSTYLPELRIGGAKPLDDMTIRTLLDYSSGIEGQFFADFGSEADCIEKYVAACNKLRMIHKPGELRAYNSTSYCIAGRLIELVTGHYFNDALTTYLLEPIGISDYSFYESGIQPGLAIGHHWDSENNVVTPDKELRLPYAMSPAGASLSLTANGLLDFALLHLFNGQTLNGEAYLGVTSISDMRTPSHRVPPNDSELLLAWAGMDTEGGRMTIASGRTIGQNAFVLFVPEQNFAMSILTNTAMGGQQLFTDIAIPLFEAISGARVTLPQPPDMPDSPTAGSNNVDALAGAYTNPNTVYVYEFCGDLFLDSSPLAADADALSPTASKLVPLSASRYLLVGPGSDSVAGTADFLFLDSPDCASHLATGGSVLGRLSE